ncbi:Dabb family protein [Legionella spiritensis]|uniref:Stress responsive A/B barrel domain protein n=1 Tax=Legionella spiritensis TaxID=452 RepID=A0A0W0YW34_LEGSP|nr:Dabb family protein [Legionella spiritensis]KTD61089.1 Stress responsive A/B barrel domain protein [Legionella spiritensis]
MLRHIVLMRFKSDISEQELNTAFEKLGDLRVPIPQILSFSYGPCASPENLHQGFLHGFTMDFTNEADRDLYLAHPQHRHVAEQFVIPLLENGSQSIIVFDYVIA